MNDDKNKKVTVVLGMHRGGTSAVTRALKVLNIELGENLHPAAEDNPTGFWEDRDVIAINEELLGLLESEYDQLNLAWNIDVNDAKFRKLFSIAVKLVSDRLKENQGVWGVKDPRISRLLGFWKQVFSGIKCQVDYIIVLRSPVSVAESLYKRNKIPFIKSYFLWLQHMVPAILDTQAQTRMLINYDSLVDEPKKQLARMAAHFQMPFQAEGNPLFADFIENFLSNDLRHTKYSLLQQTNEQKIPQDVIDIYNILWRTANDELTLASEELQTVFHKVQLNLRAYEQSFEYSNLLESELDQLNRYAQDHGLDVSQQSQVSLSVPAIGKVQLAINLSARIAERDKQIQHFNQAVLERDENIRHLDQTIVDMDGNLRILNQAVIERDGKIRHFEQTVIERDQTIQALEQTVMERDQTIQALGQTVMERDQTVHDLQLELAEREKTLNALDQSVKALSLQLMEIQDSRMWKIVSFFRRIQTALVPPNSYHSRVFQRLINLLLLPFGNLRKKQAIEKDIELIQASGMFDKDWYLATYPSVAGGDPIRHYLLQGGFAGFNPNPAFSSVWYWNTYEDVKKAGINPLVHYLRYGKLENRSINADVALLRDSAMFDVVWYSQQNLDIVQAGADPMLHYLLFGGFEGRRPSRYFDSAWYLDTYEDVRLAGLNPLIHYLRYGINEKRSINAEVALIRNSAFWDEAWYLEQYPDVAQAGGDPAVHYLFWGAFEERKPCPYFDSAWYLNTYNDIKTSGINPLIHYLNSGAEEERDISDDSSLMRNSGLFDKDWYFENNTDIDLIGIDPMIHYLITGGFEGRDPNPNFDSAKYLDEREDVKQAKINPLLYHLKYDNQGSGDFDMQLYLSLYPDVAKAGIDPFLHFVRHGRNEGRIGSLSEIYESGKVKFDPNREVVLVVSHEASRSGAPVLTLNIAQELSKKYNVVTLSPGDGPLMENFLDVSVLLVGPLYLRFHTILFDMIIAELVKNYTFKFAVVNSIVSHPVIPALSRRFIPTLHLIHEFATYTRPKEAFLNAIMWSHKVVFSANMTHDDAFNVHAELEGQSFPIIPQGLCTIPAVKMDDEERHREDIRLLNALRPNDIPSDTVLVLGAGSVQIRKGVDLFINCAANIIHSHPDKHVRFVWIGDGYNPENDMAYSIYLAEQIRRSGLEDRVFIIKDTPNLETVYKAADLLMISSRLDPLPNVGIDAMAHKLPVLCFDQATGIADVLIENGLEKECVAPHLDISEMVARVLAFVDSKSLRQQVGEKLHKIALDVFNMPNYVNQLEAIGLSLEQLVFQEKQKAEEIERSGMIDLDYYLPVDLQPEAAEAHYVRTWSSGIKRRKPFPGFHPGIYLELHEMNEQGDDPLLNYIHSNEPKGPWNYKVVTAEDAPLSLPSNIRVALHLQVDHPVVIPEILARLKKNQKRPDLFVSVSNPAHLDKVMTELKPYSGHVREIRKVSNRHPLYCFQSFFNQTLADRYELVGHLHADKDIEDRKKATEKDLDIFLLENLIGGKNKMADTILWNMVTNPAAGLVFPDDPNIAVWGDDLPFAEELAPKLGFSKLPMHFMYPASFWARAEALKPIFNLDLDWEEPSHGSVQSNKGKIGNALEKLLGLAVAKQGFEIVLTYVKGVTR